jgi:uncharacterized protein YuzE
MDRLVIGTPTKMEEEDMADRPVQAVPINIRHDRRNDIVYIYLRYPIPIGGIDHGDACEGVPIQIDYDDANRIIGLEIMLASKVLPEEFMASLVP